MEEQDRDDNSASFSWWSDSHKRRPHQSQWLQATLSDLDNKTKTILNIIQDDGDSFAKRAEMFYQRRPELINLVHDLHKSYRSLAEKYDQLRSEGVYVSHLRSTSSSSLNSSKQVQLFQACNEGIVRSTKSEAPTSLPVSVAEERCNIRLGNGSMSSEQFKILKTDRDDDGNVNGSDGLEKIINGIGLNGNIDGGDFQMERLEREKLRNGLRLQVSELIDDSLQQQSELIKRNDEKREAIKHLRAQISRLMEENRVLKSYLPSYKVDMKRNTKSHVSKLKGLNCIGKFQG
ncbi:hypothetical protein DKX38_004839 [Salix brachista]|uniref:NAB domain-containing protein n=1 Tax=Salix brachista TaxID=2182728 RepID=A0A5N5NB12_9ROSI|nr:hypothetical protein DKX38_004839 [Salix brachista]